MAQLLYNRHSIAMHLRIVKRHIRLCRQVKGAQELAQAIEPFYTDLQEKTAHANQLNEETEFKQDSLSFIASNLDDKIRDLYAAFLKHERDNPGLSNKSFLFPNGTSPIIYSPNENKPALVDRLIKGINYLYKDNLFAEHIAAIQKAVDDTNAAIKELLTATNAEMMALELANISKTNLTRQYEKNIYAASSNFGKEYANRLFPEIRTAPKPKNQENSNQ